MSDLGKWLSDFDSLPLECDGLSRVISMALQRDGVRHEVNSGSLNIAGIGGIGIHWWITFPDGMVCDFRAKMWLGPSRQVPHGLFLPEPNHQYTTAGIEKLTFDKILFVILAGMPIGAIPTFEQQEICRV